MQCHINKKRRMENQTIVISAAQKKQMDRDYQYAMCVIEKAFNCLLDNQLDLEAMANYNEDQLTLLAFLIFRREMLEGGLIQLIYNGYGPFVYENPFAKALRLWGLKEFSKFVYSTRELYEKEKKYIEKKDLSEDEFMALYEAHPEFDEADDHFVELEPIISVKISNFVLNNPIRFGIVVK